MLGWFLHGCVQRTFPALVSHGRGKEERGEEAAASSSLVRNCVGVQPSPVGWGMSRRPPAPFPPGSLAPKSALESQNPSSVVSLQSMAPRPVTWEGNPSGADPGVGTGGRARGRRAGAVRAGRAGLGAGQECAGGAVGCRGSLSLFSAVRGSSPAWRLLLLGSAWAVGRSESFGLT